MLPTVKKYGRSFRHRVSMTNRIMVPVMTPEMSVPLNIRKDCIMASINISFLGRSVKRIRNISTEATAHIVTEIPAEIYGRFRMRS